MLVLARRDATEAHLGGLVLEQSDRDIAEGSVKCHALGVGTVAAGRDGRLGGVGGGSRAAVVLAAEHRLELVHYCCWIVVRMMWYGMSIEVEVVDEEMIERPVGGQTWELQCYARAVPRRAGSLDRSKRHLPNIALGSTDTNITQQVSLHEPWSEKA